MADTFGMQGNRMLELRNKQRARQQEQFRLSQEPHFGPAKSGFANEHDYLGALNEDSELANLESLDAGRGPARSFGFYPAQGLRSQRPGVGSMSLGGGDMVDEFRAGQSERRAFGEDPDMADRANRIKGANTASELGTLDAITDSLQPRGRRALDLGYTANDAKNVGDIQRGEGLENARAGARTFMDPAVRGARTLQNAEDESLLESRYGRQADAEAKVRAAELGKEGRIGAANATAQGGISKAQIQGLLKSRELQGMLGIAPEKMQDVEDYMWRNLQPQDQAQGVDDASFNAMLSSATGADNDTLAQYWGQLTPAQQATAQRHLSTVAPAAPATPARGFFNDLKRFGR